MVAMYLWLIIHLTNYYLKFVIKFKEDNQGQVFGIFIDSVHLYPINTSSKWKF